MKKWAGFLGLTGGLVLLFGAVGGYVFRPGRGDTALSYLVYGHILAGVVLVAAWLYFRDWRAAAFGRSARFGLNAAVYSLIVAALIVTANWLVNRHNQRWDLTEEGVYSLSPQSRQIVEGLKKPLKLVAFKGNQFVNEAQVKDLFELYRSHNRSKVTTEVVDPRSKPHLVEAYAMKPGNLIYLEYGEGENKQISRINEFGEQAVTNAVIKLTRGEGKKLYYVQGHGQPGLEDTSPGGLRGFKEALSDENLTIEGILLGEKEKIPDDAGAVILVSPAKSLLAEERQLLIKYAEQGGRLLLMTDPRRPADVREIAAHFGISVGEDLVVDIVQRLFAAPALGAKILAHQYGTHAITRGLSAQDPVVFDMASSVRATQTPPGDAAAGGTHVELVKSSPNAWGETNLAAVFHSKSPSASRDEDDLKGPVSLAVAYEKKVGGAGDGSHEEIDEPAGGKFEQMTRLVVFGDSDWITNEGLSYYANRDFVLNTMNWLVGEEGGITIRPKSMKASIAPISKQTFYAIFAGSLLVPELILIFGIVVWWRRKTIEG